MQRKTPAVIKFTIEIGQLFAFFIAYHFYGIMMATGTITAFAIADLIIVYYYERIISKVSLITAGILLIMGALTLFTGDSRFIKMKPTLIYLILALVLFIGTWMDKGLLKHVLGKAISMEDSAWKIFSKRWAYFFIFLAVLNEFIWRNFSEDFWVKFKVFGITILLFSFLISQMSFINKNKTS